MFLLTVTTSVEEGWEQVDEEIRKTVEYKIDSCLTTRFERTTTWIIEDIKEAKYFIVVLNRIVGVKATYREK